MSKFQPIDGYMWLWYFQARYPDLPKHTYKQLLFTVTQLDENDIDVDEYMKTVPMKYEMIQWLSQQGFSQKTIQELLNVSQSYVSSAIHKTSSRRPYRNAHEDKYLQKYREEMQQRYYERK